MLSGHVCEKLMQTEETLQILIVGLKKKGYTDTQYWPDAQDMLPIWQRILCIR
jgi:hypothetical protein